MAGLNAKMELTSLIKPDFLQAVKWDTMCRFCAGGRRRAPQRMETAEFLPISCHCATAETSRLAETGQARSADDESAS